VIRFPIESWVEVYDREEKRLYYNLAKPDSVVDVSGAPPIRILLGRTRGVTVEFQGEPVDLAPFTERGVARLTLGP
jgi:cytoskeleton protein RodZ